jgi:hypothetical protein
MKNKTKNTKKTKKNKIVKVKTSKNKKRSIRKKINMKGGVMNIEIMKTEPFNIPIKSYPLRKSPKDIDEYSDIMRQNGIKKESIDIFKNLLEVTVHITFDNLIDSIKRTIDKFELKIKDEPFYLFIPIIEDKPIKEKSNYWISKIFYLLMNKKPREIIITSLEEIKDEMKDIIVCDDAIYSGKQMAQTFRSFNRDLTHKHNFHILCPFISQLSKDILNGMDQFNKTFYEDEIIKPFYEEYDFSASNLLGVTPKNYPIYFDHRVADNASSFPYVYELGRVCGGREHCIYLNSLLQNCNHEGLDINSKDRLLKISEKFITKCPPIPYRPGIREGKDAIRLITPEEFIDIYKNREYRRVPILNST